MDPLIGIFQVCHLDMHSSSNSILFLCHSDKTFFFLLTDISHGLNWLARYKIIKGTCEGLRYLQEGSKRPVIHMDLNPSNIFLDENMVPKIGDFGDARLLDEECSMQTIRAIGTV